MYLLDTFLEKPQGEGQIDSPLSLFCSSLSLQYKFSLVDLKYLIHLLILYLSLYHQSRFLNSHQPLEYTTLYLSLSLPMTRCASYNTDLASNSNISKTVRVNIAFTRNFLKKYLIRFLMISRLIDFALVVLLLLILKVCGMTGIPKIVFFNFLGLKGLNKIKKIKTIQNFLRL